MERQNDSKSVPANQPAVPFAQRLMKRDGSFACPKCHAKVKELPHDCRPWGAR